MGKAQVGLPLQQRPDCPAVQAPVALRTRRPYSRALGAVQHAELDSCEIRRPTHNTSKGVYFSHYRPLGYPAYRGIAGHLTYGFEVLSEQECFGAEPSGECCRFSPGVTTTDNDDVERLGHNRTARRGVIRCDLEAPTSHHRSQACDPDYLLGRNDKVLMGGADPELGAPADVLVTGVSRSTVMDPYIQHMHAALVLGVVPSNVCQRSIRLDYDRYAMQLRVPRMENVSRHLRLPRLRRSGRMQP